MKAARVYGLVLLVLFMVVGLFGCGQGQPASQSGGQSPTVSGSSEGSSGGTIKIGGLFDITGGTGDVGAPYAEGEKAYIEYVNSKGGVNGKTLELIGYDYAYKVPEAIKIYKKLVTDDKVVAVLGWGTGDTEAMKELVAKDKVPFISASYSENLANIQAHPYNFLTAATYSDQARTVLKWIKDNHKGSAPPKVALIYNDTPFGKSPIADAKAFAKEIGVEIVADVVIPLKALDTTSQLLNMQQKNPDYAIIQQTWGATATILKDAKKLGLKTQFIGLNWTAGEGLIPLAGDAAEGFIAVVTHAFPYEENLPGMAEIKEYLESKGKKLSDINQKFVQGWVTAKILVEGIKQAGDNVTGEAIKAGLEKLNNLDLGGLAAPVTFTAESHKGTKHIRLARVEKGKFVPITEYITY